jgi:plastocyanin
LFRRLLVLGAVAITAALLVACGGGDDDDSGGSDAGGASGGASQATALDMMDIGYEPESLTATAGRELSIALKNAGAQPHTFTITGVVDSGRMDGGASKNVTFTPASAGRMTFFCTVHGQAAMSGTLTVN